MKVFIDASVILAAAGSKNGGSRLILQLGAAGRIQLVTSEVILEEVMRNSSKIGVSGRGIEKLIVGSKMRIIAAPTSAQVEKYKKRIEEKDAHVFASAIQSGSETLLTLDKKHLLSDKVKNSVKNLEILSPGEFIRKLVQ